MFPNKVRLLKTGGEASRFVLGNDTSEQPASVAVVGSPLASNMSAARYTPWLSTPNVGKSAKYKAVGSEGKEMPFHLPVGSEVAETASRKSLVLSTLSSICANTSASTCDANHRCDD